MRNSKRLLWPTLLLVVVALVLVGCAPRPDVGPVTALTTDPTELVVDLPPLVIDVNQDGAFSIGTVPLAPRLAALHAAMRPPAQMQVIHSEMTAQLAAMAVPASSVEFLMRSNIQHLQVAKHAEGLSILVNGEPVSSLVWDGESLQTTAEALAMFGAPVPTILEKVLPLVQQLGVGVIVQFPVRAGEAVIPLCVKGERSMAAETRKAQAEFLEAVASPPRINVPIVYEADGSFRVGSLTDGEWSELTGLPWSMLHLEPAVLAQLSQAGVESIRLSTDTQGIHVAVNGKPLPYLSWADAEPAHLLHVTEQMALWETWAPEMNLDGVVVVVRSLLPVVQAADFDLTVSLPLAGGVATR